MRKSKESSLALRMPIPVSYSSAKLFESCPARFKAEKVDHVKGNRPIYILTGIFLHEVLDKYLKYLKEKNQPSAYDMAERIFEDMWKAGGHGIPEDMHGELLDLVYKTRGVVVLYHLEDVVGSEIQVALDHDWKKTEWDSKDVWLRMKLDRLEIDSEWNVLVWDYKTGQRIDDVEKSMQLALYAAGIKALYPKAKAITVELYYCRNGVSKELVVAPERIEEARRWITAVSNSIEVARETAFKPRPGSICMDCPIFESCPARAMTPSALPPTNEVEAQALLSRLILVNQEAENLKERLKPWCEQNGQVVCNDMMAGFTKAEKLEFPLESLMPWLNGKGIPYASALKADSKALKRLVRKDKVMQGELDAMAIDKSYSKFGLTKVK